MRRKILNLILLAGCAYAVVVTLKLLADVPNQASNGFNRKMLSGKVQLLNETDIAADANDISGRIGRSIYLATSDPASLITLDTQLRRQQRIAIPVPDSISHRIATNFMIRTDSTAIYLFAGNTPAIYRFLPGGIDFESYLLPPSSFSLGEITDSHIFVLRKFNRTLQDQVFYIYDPQNGRLKEEKRLSVIHHDGGVLSDGVLNVTQDNQHLVYLHYYTNRFIVFDTALHPILTSHTIDTTRFPRNNATTGATGYTSLKTAPVVINQDACIYGQYLLVCSSLKADNEQEEDYRQHVPVDAYDIKTGQYSGSFYLPLVHGRIPLKIKSFENKLYALYPGKITSFLPPL